MTLQESMRGEGYCADPSRWGAGYCTRRNGHTGSHSNTSGAWGEKDVFVVSDEHGDDISLFDARTYVITTKNYSLRGTLDTKRCTPYRLYFHGSQPDEWFIVDWRDIRWARGGDRVSPAPNSSQTEERDA